MIGYFCDQLTHNFIAGWSGRVVLGSEGGWEKWEK